MNLIRSKLFQSLGLLIGFYALSSQQKVSADGFQNAPWSPLKLLIKVLRQINKPVCLSVAERLAKQSGTGEAINLHLHSANLDLSDAQLLANSLTSIQPQDDLQLNSFSVSYNPVLKQLELRRCCPVSRKMWMNSEWWDVNWETMLVNRWSDSWPVPLIWRWSVWKITCSHPWWGPRLP